MVSEVRPTSGTRSTISSIVIFESLSRFSYSRLRRLLATLPPYFTYINPLRNLDTRFRGFGAIAAPALAALRGGA